MFRRDSLRHQLCREQHQRHPGARMDARADEVQVAVARVAVVRAHVAHLQQIVPQAERRALRQVQLLPILPRSIGSLIDDLCRQIGQAGVRKPRKYGAPRSRCEFHPILGLPVVDMAYRHQHHQAVAIRRCEGWIDAPRRAEVELRRLRQAQRAGNLIERGFVVLLG